MGKLLNKDEVSSMKAFEYDFINAIADATKLIRKGTDTFAALNPLVSLVKGPGARALDFVTDEDIIDFRDAANTINEVDHTNFLREAKAALGLFNELRSEEAKRRISDPESQGSQTLGTKITLLESEIDKIEGIDDYLSQMMSTSVLLVQVQNPSNSGKFSPVPKDPLARIGVEINHISKALDSETIKPTTDLLEELARVEFDDL